MALPSEEDVKLWLALLREIDIAGGSCRPAELYPRLREYFPSITDADMNLKRASGDSAWPNTIRWARMHLVHRGFIDNSRRGVWAITPKGRDWLNQHWRGPNVSYSNIDRPLVVLGGKPSRPGASHSQRRLIAAPSALTLGKEGATGDDSGERASEQKATKRQMARNSDSIGSIQGLLAKATTAPTAARFSPTEKYLLAILAYEIESHSQALSLVDTSLAEGLSSRYRTKAERLRELCSIILRT